MVETSEQKTETTNGARNAAEAWSQVVLDHTVIEMQSGFACSRKYSVSDGLPHLRPFNIGTDGEINLAEIIDIPKDYRGDLSNYELLPGDVLFNNTNSVELVGKTAIVHNPLRYAFSNHLTRLRIRDKARLEPAWLALCLRLLWKRGFFEQHCNKWIGQAGFNPTKLANVEIPLPYVDIQRRIVSRIEAIMTEIKRARTLVDEMNLYVEELMISSVNEVITKFEQTTNDVVLSSIATAFNGQASGEGNSKVRVFKTKHVYPHFLRLDKPSFMKAEQVNKLPKDRFLRSGDVLMANIAEGTLGRVTYVRECEDLWTVDTQIMILRPLNDQELLGKWLYYYLWSGRGQKSILARRSGIAFAEKRGQTHIYPKNVLEISLPVPPVEHQKQVITYLDSVQSEVNEMKRLLNQDAELLNQMEQSILERAFRGEL